MSFLKKHKSKIAAVVCIIAVLTVAFFLGDTDSESSLENYASTKIDRGMHSHKESLDSKENSDTETQENESGAEDTQTPKNSEDTSHIENNNNNNDSVNSGIDTETSAHQNDINTTKEENIEYSKESGMDIDTKTGTDEYGTEPVPVGKPVPTEPENTEITNNELVCTLSVRCDTAVGKSHGKELVLPEDGIIFPEQAVVFYEGESVFNVLVREMKKNKIHLEFVNTPIYNSAYIEGICNLYEFDCGELSGWMYKVNDWYPNYGCSRYELKDGDKVEWIYTCDMGKDIGGDYSARNGM